MAEEQQRETKNVQAGSHVVALKTFLTGREVNALKRLVYSKFRYATGEDGKTKPVMDTDASYVLDQELETLALCIVTLDGSNENVIDRLQDNLKADEYNTVKNAVNEMTRDLFKEAKPGSSTGNASTTSDT
jgi:hypothetical protein